MSTYYWLKHRLKLLRWRARRARAARRWGAEALSQSPIVLGNAMPKSGSHLLSQVLQGLARIGPFVDPGLPPVTRFEDNANLPQAAVQANLARMRPGDVAYGYLHAKEPYLSMVTRSSWATIFVYRDPRDVIVSHVFYATDLHPDHGMHRYYTEALSSMEERINAAIRGVTEPGSELSGIADKYQSYLDWLDQPRVLCLSFEELLQNRPAALDRILDHLEAHGYSPRAPRPQALETLSRSIQPERSGTFRRGEAGGWREHFTPANKSVFKEYAGELLVRLGYEDSQAW